MATSTSLTTWAAFEQYPDDGMHHEILEGELITLPPPKSGHSEIARRAHFELLHLQARKIGRAYMEAGYKLSESPATWIQPDVSFLSMERVQSTRGSDYFIGAPELAVEVVSPSESARDLERKVEALLAAGGRAVWVVYPENRKVRVFLPDGTSVSRGIQDSLTVPDLLPDWELPVSKLFED